jgi:hypothetical protein
VAKNPDLLKAKYGYWIWSHDAEKYAYENYDKASENLLNGTQFTNVNIPPGYVYKPWKVEELLAMQQAGKIPVDQGDWS